MCLYYFVDIQKNYADPVSVVSGQYLEADPEMLAVKSLQICSDNSTRSFVRFVGYSYVIATYY